MAMKPATAPIHNGNPGGSVSASSRPVMVALQSLSVLARPPSEFRGKAGTARAA